MPIDVGIFKNNPRVSSPLRGGGKLFTIVRDGDYAMYWEVPDTSTYAGAEITITRGAKREELYRYSTEDNTQLRNLPSGLKERIVSDFNTLAYAPSEEVEDAVQNLETVVRTDEVFGTTITMIQVTNSLDIRAGEDRMFYMVRSTLDGGYSSGPIQTQEEAEEAFDYQVRRASKQTDSGTTSDYRGVAIDFDNFAYNDGTVGTTEPSVHIRGEGIDEVFTIGSEVRLIDEYGTQDFGIITGDESLDIPTLHAYIDARLDGREDPAGPLGNITDLPIMSWGFYNDNHEDPLNPFKSMKLTNGYTIANTDGRILGLEDDDFIAGGIESGAVKLVVKDGYRVRLRLMTQDRNYWTDMIPNWESESISHTTYNLADGAVFGQGADYENTDKLTIDLFGGDSVEIDIDNRVSWSENFNIRRKGQTIVKGAPKNINDETFLAVIEVERFLEDSQNGDGGGNGQGGQDGQDGQDGVSRNFIAIAIGGALLLYVMYMLLAKGGDEE